MKVAVLGLGAIGGLVAGYLKAKGVDVVAVGRPEQKKAIDRDGLIIDGVGGRSIHAFDVQSLLQEKVGLAIVTVKTQDIKDVIERSREYLENTLVLSAQNGIRADHLFSKMLGQENLVSSIIMFGSTYEAPNKITHNFDGKWLIGRFFSENDEAVGRVVDVLNQAFEAVAVDNIAGMKWTKLFVNFSNCVPAILGLSMQETYSNLEVCKVSLGLLREGFAVIEKLGVALVDMPDFEVAKLKSLMQMPLEESAKIYSGIMTNLSKEPLYGSILQSIKRGKRSEIDFINGEIVNQARLNNVEAKLNTRVVELVYHVERSGKFLTIEELLKEIDDAKHFSAKDVI